MISNPNNILVDLSLALKGLDSEKTNTCSERLDMMSPLEIATLMNTQDRLVAEAVGETLQPIARTIEIAANSIQQGGRIIYVGAGTSGRLGILDASEIPPTFSAPDNWVIALIAGGTNAMFHAQEGVEDDDTRGKMDIADLKVDKRDTVIGLAASGRTPYVLGALAEARQRGAATVGISCNGGSVLGRDADIAITPIVGPEILTGSTRLKSGTAQKMVLNMISTGAMVRIGKCYGNRMVDLNASNEKLKARALNLVEDLAATSKQAALDALVETDWDIKLAILVVKTGQSVEQARQSISAANGHLRDALERAE